MSSVAESNGNSEAPNAKKAKLDESNQQPEERDFDEETQKALEDIDSCQNEIDSLNEKASEEILKVEQKYNKLRRPYYDKRNEIIGRIPKFWLTAFINHPQVASIIDEEEEDALQYMTKIEVEEYEDIKSGYRIKFLFDSKTNPYFENDSLTKEFKLGSSGDPASTSTPIRWKEGRDLAAKAALKAAAAAAQANAATAGSDARKALKKRLSFEKRTFFNWYNDNTDPATDDIAEVIKDDMWPNPLQYFLVPDIEVENGGEDEDDDEEDDDAVVLEEEDEDGEGDEDGEDEAEAPVAN